MATSISRPEKASYLFVAIKYGNPAAPIFARYTDWGQDTEGYTSTPTMGVDLPDNSGTFDPGELKVLLPLDAFTTPVASGLPASPMFIQVDEVTLPLFVGDSGSRKVLFRGRVTKTTKNFQGRNDTVAFFALPVKARLDIQMGLQCNHQCFARLFGPICQLNVADHQVFGEIASMDGKEVTISANGAITAPSSPGGNVDRFWERGYLEKDGLKIGVHIWVLTDPTVFVLRRRPPNTWLLAGGTSIKFVPGCHKSIEDCRDTWDNEEHFLGLGFAMLPYNPLFENPG